MTQATAKVWPSSTLRLRCVNCNGKHHANIVPKTTEPVKAVAFWKCKCGYYNVLDLEQP